MGQIFHDPSLWIVALLINFFPAHEIGLILSQAKLFIL